MVVLECLTSINIWLWLTHHHMLRMHSMLWSPNNTHRRQLDIGYLMYTPTKHTVHSKMLSLLWKIPLCACSCIILLVEKIQQWLQGVFTSTAARESSEGSVFQGSRPHQCVKFWLYPSINNNNESFKNAYIEMIYKNVTQMIDFTLVFTMQSRS